MTDDTRRIPERECVYLVHRAEYPEFRAGACRVRHDGFEFCPQPQLPCMCSSLRLRDGTSGADLWPALDRKPEEEKCLTGKAAAARVSAYGAAK
jgi:hypothetical protein